MNVSYVSPGTDRSAVSVRFVSERLALMRQTQLDAVSIADLLQHAYNILQFSSSEADQNVGLAVICHAAEQLPNDTMVRALLFDCISACRNFLYAEMLNNRHGKEWYPWLSAVDIFRREFYRSASQTLLTKQQHDLLALFHSVRRLVVSAPTSFGKTRLLQEIILARGYKRIALVMPTIALIAETVRRLRRDERFTSFTIVNSTSMPTSNGHVIFVLTPEKLDLFLDENTDYTFEFFAIDEIYKIQDDDRRAVFANVLYRLSTSAADFYLIGPYFRNFSERFLARTKSKFHHFGIEVVQKDEVRLYELKEGADYALDGQPLKKARGEITNLKRIVRALRDQRLVYQSTKRGTESLARQLADISKDQEQTALIDYIRENISPQWTLVRCLERGVAFHHGAMPRYIQAELVDFFNDGKIRTLVCTTTLTKALTQRRRM